MFANHSSSDYNVCLKMLCKVMSNNMSDKRKEKDEAKKET